MLKLIYQIIHAVEQSVYRTIVSFVSVRCGVKKDMERSRSSRKVRGNMETDVWKKAKSIRGAIKYRWDKMPIMCNSYFNIISILGYIYISSIKSDY